MANNLKLRFPEEYNANCPWVLFTPKKYKFPYGDKKDAKVELEPQYPGIESVALYLPGSFKEASTSSWGLQNILGGPAEDLKNAAANELINTLKTNFGAKITATASAYNGSVAMPMDLLIYEGPNPIELNFSFSMVPISQRENEIVQGIVQNFKKANNPSKSASTSGKTNTLIYPPVWDINFQDVVGLGYGETGKYTWMALKNLNISYSGESNMHIYTIDKRPTQVTLDLSFQSIKKFQD
ncbi:hypothetical protein GW796_05925 [archaeon]|nr:hypothetical protein [archaeon]NCQ51422.1 hypothetical protein [archaeon]NCT58752.1 hypothetical protein [archaeon]